MPTRDREELCRFATDRCDGGDDRGVSTEDSFEMKAFLEYVRRFGTSWLTGMSGAFSVPFVAAMVIADNKYQQAIYGALALAALGFATSRVWKTEYEQVLDLRGKLDRATAPLPDMAIDDLFSHINPEFLTRTDADQADTWDEVGNLIRDRAALGALKTWGRPVRDSVDRLLGQTEPLRLIEPSYWTIAFFTYHFFDDTSGPAPHTYLERGRSGVEYTELQVNRDEVLRIWPEKRRK